MRRLVLKVGGSELDRLGFAEDLIEIRLDLISRIRPGGFLILSGILVGKREKVRTSFEAERVIFDSEKFEGEWVGLCYRRPEEEV